MEALDRNRNEDGGKVGALVGEAKAARYHVASANRKFGTRGRSLY
jgi:hypothetical protein